MKKTSRAAASLLALTFSFILIAGCAKTPPESGSAPDHSASESVDEGVPDSPDEPDDVPDQPDQPDDVPDEPEPPAKEYASYIRCTGESVNLRSGAGTNYPVVGTAEKDTMYAVAGKTGDWYKTYYQNQTVYISAAYTSSFSIEKSDDTLVEDVIWEGYKQLGVPYVYGAVRVHDGGGNRLKGFTKSKFDCSSLVQYVFFEAAGILLQTTTRSQSVQGVHVPKEELSRGDCIYFTNASREDNTGIERIGHVAIYLGDNYILHTSSDYARIEKMSAQRWNYYVETRRFL